MKVLYKIIIAVLLVGYSHVALASNEATITLSNGSGVKGSSVSLNLTINTSQVLTNVAGVQWEFTYNPNDISGVSVTDGAAATSAGKNANCSVISSSVYRCLVVGFNSNTISNGVLSVATFTLTNSTVATQIPIQFSGLVATDSNANSVGILGTGGSITVTTPSDTTAPTVSLTAPTNNSTQSGTITVSATASDNVGVSGVQFKLDGSNLGSEDLTAPYSISWDTTGTTNTSHVLTATARDAAGNQTTSTSVSVTINNPVVDTTAPTTPTSLTSTVVSSSAINLSWTASTDAVGVTGYRIFRCAGAGCTATTQVGTATTNSYSDSGLSAGTTYRYRVTAYDLAGNASSYSSYTSATTLSVDVTPPTISSVSAGGITISGGTITWTTNELSDSLVEYGLTTGYGASSVLNSSLVTSHSVILSSLSPGTVYHYRVKSADSSGNSAVSADQTLTTLSTTDTTSPLVPTSLSATAVSTSTINLTWTASTDPTVAGQLTSGIAGYKIYRGGTQIGTSATASYTDSGLSASTLYSYTVSAYDIAGNNSAQSSSASATTQTPPPDTTPPTTPTSPVATAVSTTAINVTWTASTDAVGVTGYKIFRCVGTSCTATTQVGTTTINSYSDSGLSAGTTYRYRIIATDLAGNLSAYSTSASATTQALPDTTPPTVSMTAPPAGSTVSGTVTLTATASDNVAVQSVQFTVDGTNVGNLDTVAPYTISWDSSSVANGLRTIRAKATDTSGNTTTSSALFVTVAIPQSSDTTPPPVPINVQSSNTTSNSTTITWSPSTDLIVANQVTSGTAGYKVYRGTVLLATVSTGLTYTDTNLTPEDSYSYSVSAFDLAGNTSDQSAYLHVTTLPAPVVTPPPSGGGGGGGGGGSTPAPAPSGGGGGSPTTVYIPPTSTSTTSATTTLQITGGTTAPNITMFLPKLTTILYLGMRGGEVSILQQFLIQRGYLETTSLGYFGTKTQAGVKKYQCDNKIVCTGSESTTGYGKVGPKTRNLINSQIGAAGTTETEQQRVARLTAMIAELLKTVTKLQEQLRGMGR